MADENLYIGFDLSTQQLKVAVTNNDLQLKYETSVKFDTDLSEFKTSGGAHFHADQCTITAPVIMWVKAMDMCLEKMKNDGIDFNKIAAIGGDAQQHGSVYWRRGASEKLKNLDKTSTLHEQLKEAFSVEDSPIWMDGSTEKQCRMMEDCAGSPLELARLTGARCFHRFTGAQIAKIYELYPDKYNDTERISLVSNFAASLLISDYADIDYSDGSGMSLMDVNTKQFVDKLVQACAPDLAGKLGKPVPSYSVVGSVGRYLVERYGFRTDCKVVAFVGDNAASVAGLRLQEGEIMVTMGTSDCVISMLSEPTPTIYSCQIASAVHREAYFGLLCFKNSSTTRERIMEERAGSWEKFNHLLSQTPCGNNGNIGFYFDNVEVIPQVIGVYRFDAEDKEVSDFDAVTEVRAVLEGHFMARRMHAENCGINMATAKHVLATGGASANTALLQVLADVFGCDVYTIDVPNSASLGNCFRAKHGILGGPDKVDYFKVVPPLTGLQCVAKPTEGAKEIYDKLIQRYKRLEERVMEKAKT